MGPLVSQLASRDGNQNSLAGGFELAPVEGVPACQRFGVYGLQVERHRRQWRGMCSESLELRVMPVSDCMAAKHFLCE